VSLGEIFWKSNASSRRICLIWRLLARNFRADEFWIMAEKENKYEDNAAGKYYCDEECIDCDLCRETAPENFKRNEDGGYSFVYKQPENDEEEALCVEAMEGCPVEAIGSDGSDD
jgi:ferredoxin